MSFPALDIYSRLLLKPILFEDVSKLLEALDPALFEKYPI